MQQAINLLDSSPSKKRSQGRSRGKRGSELPIPTSRHLGALCVRLRSKWTRLQRWCRSTASVRRHHSKGSTYKPHPPHTLP